MHPQFEAYRAKVRASIGNDVQAMLNTITLPATLAIYQSLNDEPTAKMLERPQPTQPMEPTPPEAC